MWRRLTCIDERYFEKPDEFVPERWTTHPEMVKDASVYTPFSIGELFCKVNHA